MLTGIIPQDSGEIVINGLVGKDKIELQKVIGVIPESRGFYDWMSGEEYLLFFANLYKVTKPMDAVNDLLEKVGLTSRKNSKIATYSRGMKQRIGLARALINNPKILFLDEPTLGLDPRGQEDIQNLLKQLNKQGTTIFFSSHQLNEVANLCSTVAIINHGKLIAQGTIEEIQKQANLQGSSLKDLFLNLTNE
jgi:ABC-2 type transport system ATP-binding protein